jgi:hypothetical protein
MDETGTLFGADEPESVAADTDEPESVAADTDVESEPDPDVESEPDPDVESEPDPVAEGEPEDAAPASTLTLDEMVAALAGPDTGPDAGPQAEEEPVAGDAEAAAEDAGDAQTAPEDAAAVAGSGAEIASAAAAEPAPDAASVLPQIARRMWTRVPLWVIFAAFPVLTGTLVYRLWSAATGGFTTHPYYRILVLGGAALVLVGLVTGCAIWLSARSRAGEDEKAGLARVLWTRSLAWTAGGVALWWIGLVILDLRHTGVLG